MTKQKKVIHNDKNYPLIREYKAHHVTMGTLRRFGAHSAGIGRKVVKGQATDRLSLRFYVTSKRPLSLLPREQQIPAIVHTVSQEAGKEVRFPTDVIEMPQARFSAEDPESKIRPVPGGVSGGLLQFGQIFTGGTLGGWVVDTTDNTFVMITNAHVVGGSSTQQLPGGLIIQPGFGDGGTSENTIGEVKRVVPIEPINATNTVDCAIVEPTGIDMVRLQVLDIGPAVYAIETAIDDMEVEKFGQTTHHTSGQVVDADWSGDIVDFILEEIFHFEDCILIEASSEWSDFGDSGSIVFAKTNTSPKPAVGLHFASMTPQCGVACKIHNVFHQLNLAPVCSGGFSMFIDELFETETTIQSMPSPPVNSERRKHRARSFTRGMARDVQRRLRTTESGRVITDFVDNHRAELLELLMFDGDVRRATVAALKPLLAGATTTTDALERILTGEDLQRLDKLAREVSAKGTSQLRAALKIVSGLKSQAEGRSWSKVLNIETEAYCSNQ